MGLLCAPALAAAERPPFQAERAGFSLRVRDEVCPYQVLGVYVLPQEELPIQVVFPPAGAAFDLTAGAGTIRTPRTAAWSWRAPAEAGLYPLTVSRQGSGQRIVLNVFVMVPASRVSGGRLNGYRIDIYPEKPYHGLPQYEPPRGFIELTPENAATPISPHFTLGQFACKQTGGYPKYLVLRERLLLKLEYLLRLVNERGIRTDSFTVMSGFRTPYYNRAIGNVKNSRHQWGGAADIYIDESPKDGRMDDLNRDGRVDERDAALLFDLIEAQWSEEPYEPYRGGLGNYGSSSAHGPFVHVDVRGFRARWGR